MPSVHDVAHDGWLWMCTFTMSQQLEILSARNWAAPVRATVTVRKKAGGTALPSRTKSHLPGHSSPASQAGRRVGPASIVVGLNGCRYGGRRGAAVSWRCSLYHVVRAHVLSPPFYDGVRFFHPLPFLSLSRPYCWFLLFFFTSCHSFVLLSFILLACYFLLFVTRSSVRFSSFFTSFSIFSPGGFSYIFEPCTDSLERRFSLVILIVESLNRWIVEIIYSL